MAVIKKKSLLLRAASATCMFALMVFGAPAPATAAPARASDAGLDAIPVLQSGLGRHVVNDPLAPSGVYTDVYEPNDTVSTASPLSTVGIVQCPIQNQVVNNASFYKYDPSQQDIDFYTVQLTQPAYYTFTVQQAISTTPVSIRFTLYDNGGNFLGASYTTNPVIPKIYVAQVTTVRLSLMASNYTIGELEEYPYNISICSSALTPPTATPTSTPTTVPTATPIATSTPTPTTSSFGPDAYEPNDNIFEALGTSTYGRTTASFISNGQTIAGLNFNNRTATIPDTADWFEFYGRSGSVYQVTTSNVQPGVDTVLTIFQGDNATQIGSNDRYVAGKLGSQVTFQAGVDGFYWAKVINRDPSPRVAGQTYSLSLLEIVNGTVTATPTVARTPFPGTPDKFDLGIGTYGNGSFDDATLIAPDFAYKGLNFVPYNPSSVNAVDNDFFRLPVKQGIYYTCESSELAPGVDTNMIVYNSDRVGIGGNDDVSLADRNAGKFGSRVTWLATYTGFVYVLVGEVYPHKANEAGGTDYTLMCKIGLPNTPTPGATSTPGPAGSGPGVPIAPQTPTAIPTQRPPTALSVRPVDRNVPAPTPAPVPTPRMVSVNVQVFNDANHNGALDLGEGISGVSVRLSDEQTGAPLAQSSTDGGGLVRFSAQNDGPVRIQVPLFGYTALITEQNATIRIGLVSEVELPQRLP